MVTDADAAYVDWVNTVHQLGGVATVWPFGGPVATTIYDAKTGLPSGTVYSDPVSPDYGKPAARFPAETFAQLAGQSLPMANGVQFNVPGTWVYVMASAMTGNYSVDDSADAMLGATKAEAEQACAVNGNCPTDLEKLLKTIAISAAVVAGAYVATKTLNVVKDWE